MILYDNLLSQELSDDLLKTLSGPFFPWYYTPFTAYSKQFATENTRDVPQFTHGFYANSHINSKYFNMVIPIMDLLPKEYNKNNLVRAKANLIYKNSMYPMGCHNTPHADMPDMDTTSLVYYVNDSDGDTVFFQETPDTFNGVVTETLRNKPKKNQAVLFNSKHLHTSVPPRENDIRIIINFVFNNEEV